MWLMGSSLPLSLKIAALEDYGNRFTCEHIPKWALEPGPQGRWYAPQYATDREWLDKSLFDVVKAGEFGLKLLGCRSENASFPLGQWLDAPYREAA